jgi:hypothetical protein
VIEQVAQKPKPNIVLGVIFDRKMTWGLHIKTIENKAFRAFIKT